MSDSGKSSGAFRTIGELSTELGLPQHILRYWETRFSQLKPLQRAGNRRYYRPDDVALAHRINRLLNQDGYTVKGVQKLLAESSGKPKPAAPLAIAQPARGKDNRAELIAIRDRLAHALAADDVAARL